MEDIIFFLLTFVILLTITYIFRVYIAELLTVAVTCLVLFFAYASIAFNST